MIPPPDDGGGNPPDTGRPDTGIPPRPDAGPHDSGPPDTGVDPNMDMEGGHCTPGATDQGSCMDPSNVCVTWSPQGATMPVSTCIRPCNATADCANSLVGQVCAGVTLNRDRTTTRISAQKACVVASVNEGEKANVSLSHAPAMMTGCADGLVPLPWFFGSALFTLDDDQASCGIPCGSDMDCEAFPQNKGVKCVGGVFNSTTTPGLCQTRYANKGGRCSTVSANEMCNTSSVAPGGAGGSQSYLCLDFGLNNDENVNGANYGICVELCRATGDCKARTDANPAHMIACETGIFTDPALGLCDDNCNSFPDDCKGMGSPAAAGATQNGMTCAGLANMAGTINLGLCADVSQTATLFAPFNFMTGVLPEECMGDGLKCPDRTVCLPVDQMMHNGCVYGCDTGTATVADQGCVGTTPNLPNCMLIAAPPGTEGVCTPGM